MYMGKVGKVWVNNESYYDQHKDAVPDLGKFTNPHPDLPANTLQLTKGEKAGHARIVYVSPKQNIFQTELGLRDNGYSLLFQLATRPRYMFTTKLEYSQLGKSLKETGNHTEKTKDDYNRIRYAMDFLRDRLGLKNYKEEDPFVSIKGFGLMCDTIIKM